MSYAIWHYGNVYLHHQYLLVGTNTPWKNSRIPGCWLPKGGTGSENAKFDSTCCQIKCLPLHWLQSCSCYTHKNHRLVLSLLPVLSLAPTKPTGPWSLIPGCVEAKWFWPVCVGAVLEELWFCSSVLLLGWGTYGTQRELGRKPEVGEKGVKNVCRGRGVWFDHHIPLTISVRSLEAP